MTHDQMMLQVVWPLYAGFSIILVGWLCYKWHVAVSENEHLNSVALYLTLKVLREGAAASPELAKRMLEVADKLAEGSKRSK